MKSEESGCWGNLFLIGRNLSFERSCSCSHCCLYHLCFHLALIIRQWASQLEAVLEVSVITKATGFWWLTGREERVKWKKKKKNKVAGSDQEKGTSRVECPTWRREMTKSPSCRVQGEITLLRWNSNPAILQLGLEPTIPDVGGDSNPQHFDWNWTLGLRTQWSSGSFVLVQKKNSMRGKVTGEEWVY